MGHSFQAARSKAIRCITGYFLLDEEMQLAQKHGQSSLPGLFTRDYQVKILFQITDIEVSNFFKSHIQIPKNYGHIL